MSHKRPTPDRHRDEAEIRTVETTYDRAWGSADVAAMMSLLEPDVVIVSPMGETRVGASEARRLLQDFLSGAGLGSTHTSRPRRISFVSGDVALFDGQATIEGPNLPESLVHDFTDVFIRRENRWRIAHVRAYVFLSADGSPEVKDP